MLRKRTIVELAMLGVLLAPLATLATRPASSGCEACKVWGDTIIGNTTISGLIKSGESQRICFLGNGRWINGIPIEVCTYALWRIHGQGQDMQAYIELAKLGDRLYSMEIYHSWNTLTVSMPYNYTVKFEEPHMLSLRIEADI